MINRKSLHVWSKIQHKIVKFSPSEVVCKWSQLVGVPVQRTGRQQCHKIYRYILIQ